ncbi:DUF3253 domain-containing protein [Halomonas denitrificans]|nr:DUF3253 domain-containing protein [Halomonas denitrificans]
MTDDDRWFEVDGRRWRRTDPAIPDSLEQELVAELMAARRAVKSAKDRSDESSLRDARARVQDAKVALGERGAPWWEPREEEALRERLSAAIRTLLRKRGDDKTICPSDAARIAGGEEWRDWMRLAHDVAWRLADEGWLDVLQDGERVSAPPPGPIRLKRRD